MRLCRPISASVRARGFMMKDEFLQVVAWKAARQKTRAEKNSDGAVEGATRAAFAPFADVKLLDAK